MTSRVNPITLLFVLTVMLAGCSGPDKEASGRSAQSSESGSGMVLTVAEALREPVADGCVRAIRWTPDGYVLDRHPLDTVTMADPRQFSLRQGAHRMLALTSLSWLLPVELSPDGRRVGSNRRLPVGLAGA